MGPPNFLNSFVRSRIVYFTGEPDISRQLARINPPTPAPAMSTCSGASALIASGVAAVCVLAGGDAMAVVIMRGAVASRKAPASGTASRSVVMECMPDGIKDSEFQGDQRRLAPARGRSFLDTATLRQSSFIRPTA